MKRPDRFCQSWVWAEYQMSIAPNKATYLLWSTIRRVKLAEFYAKLWKDVRKLEVGSKVRHTHLEMIYGFKSTILPKKVNRFTTIKPNTYRVKICLENRYEDNMKEYSQKNLTLTNL